MSIFKAIFHNLKNSQGMSDAQALTYARSVELKRPKDAPGTPMFREWRKLIVEVKAVLEGDRLPTVAQIQAVADAEFIAWTGCLPQHDDFWDAYRLRGAKDSEMIAESATRSGLEKSKGELKVQMMGLSDSQLSQFKRDFLAIPIIDQYFGMVQDILAVCESVQRDRVTEQG
jgi:hypothetical protein